MRRMTWLVREKARPCSITKTYQFDDFSRGSCMLKSTDIRPAIFPANDGHAGTPDGAQRHSADDRGRRSVPPVVAPLHEASAAPPSEAGVVSRPDAWALQTPTQAFYQAYAQRLGGRSVRTSSPTRRHFARYGTTVASLPRASSRATGRPPDPYASLALTLYHRFESSLVPHIEGILRDKLGIAKTYGVAAVAHEGVYDTLAMFFDLSRAKRETDDHQGLLRKTHPALWIDDLIPKDLEGRARAAVIQSTFENVRRRVGNDVWLFGTSALEGQRVLMTHFGLGHDCLLKILRGAGLVPPMNDACATLAKLDFAYALAAREVELEALKPTPAVVLNNPDDFFRTPAWRRFSARYESELRGQRKEASAFLGHADYVLLKALRPLSWPTAEGPRREVLGALARLTELLERYEASDHTNPKGYGLTHELIHEELRFILDVVRPYGRGDLTKLYHRHRAEGGRGAPARRAPQVFAFNSGMACVDALLRVVMKSRPDDDARVAFSSLGYFETLQTLEILRPLKDGASRTILVDSASADLSISEPFDLLFAVSNQPFHFELGQEYHPVDLRSLISRVTAMAQGTGGRRVVLAVDVTLALPGSPEMDAVIREAASGIDKGLFDLVLFRSAQKYDLLGVDRISAGIMEVYSPDDRLTTALRKLSGQLEGGDGQMLTHLQHARAMSDAYPRFHAENARHLRQVLKPMTGSALLQIAPCTDASLTFVALESHAPGSAQIHLSEHVQVLGQSVGLALVERDSFGFNHATVDAWPSTIRLSLGMEPEAQITAFGGTLLRLEEDLISLSQPSMLRARTNDHRVPQAFEPPPLSLHAYYAGRTTALRWCADGLPQSRALQVWTWAPEQWELWRDKQAVKQPRESVAGIGQTVMSHSIGLADGLREGRGFDAAFAEIAAALIAVNGRSPALLRPPERRSLAQAVGRLAERAVDQSECGPRSPWGQIAEDSNRLILESLRERRRSVDGAVHRTCVLA